MTVAERRAWLALAAIAVVLAALDVARWLAAVASDAPVGYGEGAVVHAGAILARGGDPYAVEPPGVFVSANYPPLAYVVVALGRAFGPFAALRAVNVILACAVAALVAWRARGERAVAVALGASFLALYPVGAWVAGDRVDVLAVAATAFAVAALASERPLAFGLLGALALAAKPTAAVPLAAVALAALFLRARGAWRAAVALAVASAALVGVALARFDARGLVEHLVTNNALPYDPRNPALLLVVGALLLGAYALAGLRVGAPLYRAYLAGALGVVLLGGHEGATINYLLDVAAASCLAAAPLARARAWWVAPALAAQLAATLALTTIGPFAPPSLDAARARVAILAPVPGATYLAEDSGLLVAHGLEPVVDDLFVWGRLVALGVRADDLTPRVSARAFDAIVSDVPLDALATAPEIERSRWPPALVDATLREYELRRAVPGASLYLPRGRP